MFVGEYNARYLVVVRLRGRSLTENRKYSNGSHSKKPHLVTVVSVFTQEAPPSFKVESKFKDGKENVIIISRLTSASQSVAFISFLAAADI